MVERACKKGIPVDFYLTRRIMRREKNSIDYLDLSETYLNDLITHKTCLFLEDGRALKNYMEIATLKPDFDRINLVQKIQESYNLDSVDIDKENEFINAFIQNNSIAKNEDEFNEFLNHLQLVKLKNENFCMPQEYVDYIIKQALEPDSVISNNPETYLHLVECAIQDLGKNDLYQSIDQKYEYYVADFVETDTLKTGEAGGYCNSEKKYIKLDRNNVRRLIKEKDVYILDTVFHENTHAKQHFDFENPNMDDYNRYVMQKEEILRNHYSDFYKDNYTYTFIEIEAREKAALKLSSYIDSLNISEQSSLRFLDAVGDEISEACADVVKKENSRYGEGLTKNIAGKSQNVIEAFENLIKQNPNLVKRFYQLGMEYHEDGRKRSLKDILSYAVNFTNSSQTKVVSEIIKNGNIMKPDTFLDDMEVLMSIKPESEATNSMIEDIIKDNICMQIWENVGLIENFDYEKLNRYRFVLEKIQDRVRNFDDAFSKGMKTVYNDHNDSIIDDVNMLKEKVDLMIERRDKDDELGSITFSRRADAGVTQEELYDIENEFIEREEKDRIKRKQSIEEKIKIRIKNFDKRKRR